MPVRCNAVVQYGGAIRSVALSASVNILIKIDLRRHFGGRRRRRSPRPR